MLTGDKVETATCIAISTGIKSKKQGFFYIRDIAHDDDALLRELDNFNTNFDKVLTIDGECLLAALDKHEKLFFEAAMKVKYY
jgi:phospholipid-translocating ATPase